MTDAKELARVRAIHQQLDAAAERGSGAGLRIRLTVSGGLLEYTADEVRAWPKLKAELLHIMQREPGAHTCYQSIRGIVGSAGYPITHEAYEEDGAPGAIARGLCLYREMLDDQFPEVGEKSPAEKALALADLMEEGLISAEQARKILAPAADPYAEHKAETAKRLRVHNRYQPGLSLDEMCRASMEIEDNAHDEWKQAQTGERQVSPRERNIAALAAELRRPVTPRFPPEGRSCRVYRSNDR